MERQRVEAAPEPALRDEALRLCQWLWMLSQSRREGSPADLLTRSETVARARDLLTKLGDHKRRIRAAGPRPVTRREKPPT